MNTPLFTYCVNILDKYTYVRHRTIVVSLDVVYSLKKLLKYARKKKYRIVVIAYRQPAHALEIHRQLQKKCIPYDNLFTMMYVGEHPMIKVQLREAIELVDLNNVSKDATTFELFSRQLDRPLMASKIILTIGDNWYDVMGSNDYTGVKMSNIDDRKTYVYTQDKSIISIK